VNKLKIIIHKNVSNLRKRLYRCQDIALRKEYVNIVEAVKDSSGDVKIFSSMHISGERMYLKNIIF
jgi:stalled ribosome rescue protein Dom34